MPTVSLRAQYCPICFRGAQVITKRVPHDCERINEEQRQCSLATRGLPLLDLSAEGPRCRPRCNMICAACGNPMAFPCESDYSEALDAVDQFLEDELETRSEVCGVFMERLSSAMLAAAETRLQRRLRPLGMAWHPRWRRLVHSRCVKKEACGCLLTVGYRTCPVHIQKRLLPSRAPRAPMPCAPSDPPEITRATPRRPVVMTQATWLQKPTSMVAIAEPAKAAPLPASAPRPRKAPERPKPNPRLVNAAKGCGRLDAWRDPKTMPMEPRITAGTRPPFDARKYEREFDPFKHGYFRKNGVDMFLFPDGWVEQVTSPVNRITEDGRLVPG